MGTFLRIWIAALAVVLFAPWLKADLLPARLDQFVALPNSPTVLQFSGAAPSSPVQYTLTNYAGATCATGQQSSLDDGTLTITLTLPGGYYELAFDGNARRFGLVVAPVPPTAVDSFFAIDAALSWLETDANTRGDYLNILQRMHVGTVRERLYWEAINPTAGSFDWQSDKDYDTLRANYLSHGLRVLEVIHSAPAYLGTTAINPFPSNLLGSLDSFSTLAQHWSAAWSSFEAWNEPDSSSVFFAKEMPADQYAPMAKTFAFSLATKSSQTLMGGGVLVGSNLTYLAQALDNGLLDQIDFLSFHNYFDVLNLEATVGSFRTALAGRSRAAIPLWMSESGWKWTAGTDRPVLAEDRASALEITMKAVEARACGVARYFPFVFPYYVEGNLSYGMMGQEGTPLRSLSAYAQAIVQLSGATYVGDLQGSTAAARARLFTRADGTTCLVLYTGVANPAAVFTPSQTLSVTAASSVDGRPLTVGAGGAIPIPDGLTYVNLTAGSLGSSILNSATNALSLASLSRASLPARGPMSPIVLQFPPPSGAVVTKVGYQVSSAQLASFPLSFNVNNLSAASRTVTLNIAANGVNTPRSVTVPAHSVAAVAATVALPSPEGTIAITGSDDLGVAVSPMSLHLFSELSVNQYLALSALHSRLNLLPASQWGASTAGSMALSDDGSTLHMDLNFPAGISDRWAYPQFNLAQPQSPDWTGLSYIIIRARASQAGTVRLFLVESTGAFYYTANPVIPADGQWHTAYIPISAFSVAGGHPDDADGKLDPNQIVSLQIGMNSGTTSNTLDISDYYLVNTATANLVVEQPAGSVVLSGGRRSVVAALGASSPLEFRIRNLGSADLTGLTITKDGANAGDFTVAANPASPVNAAGGETTLTVQFTPQAAGLRTATLHVVSNDPAHNPYDLALTGTALSWSQDSDGDGLSDAAEFQMSALGFDWQVKQAALVQAYFAAANGAGLYTAAQVQALNVGTPVLGRDASTGQFKLTVGVKKSSDLTHYLPFPMTSAQTVINSAGELEFRFAPPDSTAFYKLQSR